MRDGSSPADPRLGRLPQWDEKNRDFPVRSLFGDVPPRPRSYTWRVGTWLDQGQSSACTGFSFAAELAARPVVVAGVTNALGQRFYRRAQQLDQWEGEEPAVQGSSVLAAAKAVTEAGHYTGYRWCFGEPQLAITVGYHGTVVAGTDWHADMMDVDERGYVHPSGGVVGGHAYLIHAVSVARNDYVIHNSWGRSWGVNGTARITRGDMATLLASDGEACVPVRQKVPA